MSPKTTIQSGRSRSIASAILGRIAIGVGGVEVEPVARLRQPELVVEDVGELGVPVLPGVQPDLLDPRGGERGRERADLMNCGRFPTTVRTFTERRYNAPLAWGR